MALTIIHITIIVIMFIYMILIIFKSVYGLHDKGPEFRAHTCLAIRDLQL